MGGIVTAVHNEICYRVRDIYSKYFTPAHVCDDPLIFAGHSVQMTKTQPAWSTHQSLKNKSEVTEQRGNLMICNLLQNETDSVHDMRVMNTNSKYHLEKTP